MSKALPSLVLLLFPSSGESALAQTGQVLHQPPADSITQNVADIASITMLFEQDERGRYLVTGATCAPVDQKQWPGYETLPQGTLKRCTYSVYSCTGLKERQARICMSHRKVAGPKEAVVVLYEPGPERLARWIFNACAQVGGNRVKCLQSLYQTGKTASSWQIPVAGIVYEDMEPRYVHYGYAFRDSVTVRPDEQCAWINGHPEGERAPTKVENLSCSRPTATPLSASDKIRPLSTTLQDLLAWQPDLIDVLPKGKATGTGWHFVGKEQEVWRNWVRETQVAAASTDSNPLFIAKAAALRREGKF